MSGFGFNAYLLGGSIGLAIGSAAGALIALKSHRKSQTINIPIISSKNDDKFENIILEKELQGFDEKVAFMEKMAKTNYPKYANSYNRN